MKPAGFEVQRIDDPSDADIAGLAEVLLACVEVGASVSFMNPFSAERGREFWTAVARDVRAGERVLLVAIDDLGIVGTVQLVLKLPENQPHRVDVAKLLVHPRGRRRGIAAALMRAAEAASEASSRWLMVLDTMTGSDAARLYERLGWRRAGDIPDYALFPKGGLCSTTFYYRDLRHRTD